MLMGMNMVQLELLIAAGGVLAFYAAARLLLRLAGERRALTVLGGVFLASLMLICIGELIEVFGVALRRVPLLVLVMALGMSMILLTMVWGEGAARRQTGTLLRWAARSGVALLCAVMVTGFAVVLLFAMSGSERMVEHQGQRLVERDIGFLDSHYQYHVSYGPLFRGSEVLYSGEQRLV